jgi:hypothetical protein
MAKAIVRATAIRYLKEPEEKVVSAHFSYRVAGEIEFKVQEVLKGEVASPGLGVRGFLGDRDDFNDGPVPYKWGRPGTKGGCIAEWYKRGADHLLFLVERDGRLVVSEAPLSAVNEQLRSGEDPWLLWVRDHLSARKEQGPGEWGELEPFTLSVNGWTPLTFAGAS